MKLYRIKPFDTVFFGENRSSVAGDDHEKGAKFPPEIMKLFNLGNNRFLGVFPMKGNDIYLPMPADVMHRRKSEENYHIIPRIVEIEAHFATDLCTRKLPWIDEFGAFERAGGYLKVSDFVRYMKVPYGKLEVHPEKDLFMQELRIGIALNYSTRTVKESMLYAHVHVRTTDGFAILVHGEIGKTYENVGGERKVARIEELDYPSFLELEKPLHIVEGDLYKFYLTTHAFLSDSMLPYSSIYVQDIEMELVWLFSAGSEWIGGFGKPAILTLKPGTVLILKAKMDGEVSSFAQITDPLELPDKDSFLGRGWGSGILWKLEGG